LRFARRNQPTLQVLEAKPAIVRVITNNVGLGEVSSRLRLHEGSFWCTLQFRT
jgi:hypothetical protein